ncbi:MAG: mannose-1-phosphate guanylyltransferase [Bacteroidales bacterium]|nr:mannose-1-phosphate guanylyltransferase [Bacteroidales bacterium]
MTHNHIVIMAGGVGSRLYPVSTPEHPKQFIDLLDCGKTLIQLTYERFLRTDPDARFWVVTSARYIHFVREQLPAIPEDQILAEPEARNTAPCIAYACWKIRCKDAQANIIVTPADAYVPDCDAFAATMHTALDFTATRPAIVCVGIHPDSPHTGYGYIYAPGATDGIVKVAAFKEKPSQEVAESYLAEGGYFWNAGIFVWNLGTIEAELRRYAPQICGVMDALAPALFTPDEKEALTRLFPTCEKISIDYAVMEKSDQVHMIPGRWVWSDLGSFEAIEKITGKKLK